MYDAAMAIAGTHRPFVVTPTTPAAGASMEAAVAAAAYGVLKGLFPNRTAVYQAKYDDALATITDAAAKAQGVALGTEVANAVSRPVPTMAGPPCCRRSCQARCRGSSAASNPIGRTISTSSRSAS